MKEPDRVLPNRYYDLSPNIDDIFLLNMNGSVTLFKFSYEKYRYVYKFHIESLSDMTLYGNFGTKYTKNTDEIFIFLQQEYPEELTWILFNMV